MVAIVAAIPATLGAIVGVVNKMKLTEIHVLTNSNLTRVTADLALANARIEKLETLLMKKSDA